MKNIFLKMLVLVFVLAVIVAFDQASAASVRKGFGGTVLNTKATEIQSLENSNYKCAVPGTTITIKAKGNSSPTTYLIPSGIKTKNVLRAGSHIKGLYTQSKTSITCVYQGYPPSQTTTTLTPISIYGSSR